MACLKQTREEKLVLMREARKEMWSYLTKLGFYLKESDFSAENLVKHKMKDLDLLTSLRLVGQQNVKDKNDVKKINLAEVEYGELAVIDRKTNSSLIGHNKFYKLNWLVYTMEYVYLLEVLKGSQTEASQIEVISNLATDLQQIQEKLLYKLPEDKIAMLFIKGKIEVQRFKVSFSEFEKNEIIPKCAKMKIEVVDKDKLTEISNSFVANCQNIWLPTLEKSISLLNSAVEAAEGYFYQYPTFSVKEIMEQLVEIYGLKALLQSLKTPKFADLLSVVTKISALNTRKQYFDREDDDLPFKDEKTVNANEKEAKEAWEKARKINKEKELKLNNLLFTKEVERITKLKNIENSLKSKISEISQVNLLDVSKVPKDIASEIIQIDLINKKLNKDYLNSIEPKTTVDSYDLVYLFRSIASTMSLTLFVNNLLPKVQKLFKYLKLNNAKFSSLCSPSYKYLIDDKLEIKENSVFLMFNKGPKKTSIFYCVSKSQVNSATLVFKTEGQSDELITLYREFLQLKVTLKSKEGLSQQVKERDLKYLQKEYEQLCLRFAMVFCSQKEQMKDPKKISKLIDVKVFKKVESGIMDKMIDVLKLEPVTIESADLNEIWTFLHKMLIE